MDKNKYYRQIPKVDILLENAGMKAKTEKYGKEPVLQAVHEVLGEIRQQICKDAPGEEIQRMLENLGVEIEEKIEKKQEFHFKRVINGTGILLHTNLGRAPFSASFAEELTKRMTGYSNLEFDLDTGKEENASIILKSWYAELQVQRQPLR